MINLESTIINNQTLVAVLNYLSERPYRDVKVLIDTLNNDIVTHKNNVDAQNKKD